MEWQHFKAFLVHFTGLDRDALHIYAGILLQMTAALVLRRRLGDIRPLAVVLVVEILNEAADLSHEIWPDRLVQWLASAHDLLNTMAVPALIYILMRRATRAKLD